MKKKAGRPGLLRVLSQFFLAITLLLLVRVYGFEVFVIPSGSMYPMLYINDYIFVTKYDFGMRVPLTQKWVVGPKNFKRNDIVVFKSPDKSKFYVKRLVGLSGDKVVIHDNFILSINGVKLKHTKLSLDQKIKMAKEMGFLESDFDAYVEESPQGYKRTILVSYEEDSPIEKEQNELNEESREILVPQGKLLFMGDHRHRSYDGRRFGPVPSADVVGKAKWIALSCQSSDGSSHVQACGLGSMRFDRMGKPLTTQK